MKKNILEKFKQYIFTCIGAALTGFAVSLLFTPNKIVCGGLAGISTILYQTFKVAPGKTYAVTNVVLLVLAERILGKSFVLKTILGAGMVTLFVHLFSYLPTITDNAFMAAIFGGTIQGLGMGIAFAAGASTGGMDILGRISQHFLPRIPIGKWMLIINGAVLLISLIVFKDIRVVLLSLLSLFLSTTCVDFVIKKVKCRQGVKI